MKLSNQIRMILLTSILAGAPFCAQAEEGGQGSGGGDICENRIKQIRSDIEEWIQLGNSKALQLPKEISHATYSAQMLMAISKAKIKCVGKGDQGYPVKINNTPKTCRFDVTKKSSRITCDYKKFAALAASDQYVLVHHEYAGIAAIEKPKGDDSKYDFSNQISDHLREERVLKLVVASSRKAVDTQDTIPKLLNIFDQPMTALSADSKIVRDAVKGLEFVDGNYQNGKRVYSLDESLPFCTIRTAAPVPPSKDRDADFEFKILTLNSYRNIDMNNSGKPVQNWTSALLMEKSGHILTLSCAKRSRTLFLPVSIAEVQTTLGDEFLLDGISAKRLVSPKSFEITYPTEYEVTPADILGTERKRLRIDLPAGILQRDKTLPNFYMAYVQGGLLVDAEKVDYSKPHAVLAVKSNEGEDLNEKWFAPGELKIESVSVSTNMENRLKIPNLMASGSLVIRGTVVDGHKVDVLIHSPVPKLPTIDVIQNATGRSVTWVIH